jgi:hypothetical protein
MDIRLEIWSIFITKECDCFPRSTSSSSSANSMDVGLDSLREIWVSAIVQVLVPRSRDSVSYDNPRLDPHPKLIPASPARLPPLLYDILISSYTSTLTPFLPCHVPPISQLTRSSHPTTRLSSFTRRLTQLFNFVSLSILAGSLRSHCSALGDLP